MNLLNKDQVAERLNLTRRELNKLLRERELPCLKIGKAVRVAPADLEKWLEGKKITAITPIKRRVAPLGILRKKEGKV